MGFSSFLNLFTMTNLALVLSFFSVAKFRSDQLVGSLMHPVVQKTFGYWIQAKLARNALVNSFWEFVASVCNGLTGVTLSQKTDQLRPFSLSYSLSQVMGEGCKPGQSVLFAHKLWMCEVPRTPVTLYVIHRLSVLRCWRTPPRDSVTLLKLFPLCLVTKQPTQ